MKQQNKIQKFIQTFDDPEAVSNIKDQFIKVQETLACYRCALLEVETKFRVLDERFSIRNERNPIESIKSRIK
ncbi:MAG: GTP pyrophosphokinase family protein, partial [Christensenellales bacterium]